MSPLDLLLIALAVIACIVACILLAGIAFAIGIVVVGIRQELQARRVRRQRIARNRQRIGR